MKMLDILSNSRDKTIFLKDLSWSSRSFNIAVELCFYLLRGVFRSFRYESLQNAKNEQHEWYQLNAMLFILEYLHTYGQNFNHALYNKWPMEETSVQQLGVNNTRNTLND